ncbi:hypothetical protein JW777_01190 [bacterium]|nr:hypothetical protein [bacterium]
MHEAVRARRRAGRLVRFLAFLLAGPPALCLSSGTDGPYFYHSLTFGSESLYNPVFVVLNGGYSILQAGNRDRDPFSVDYRTGWKNVWRNVSDPIGSIRTFGWRKFLTTEVIPMSLAPKSAQYVPNYQSHLIGSGMTFRQLSEWYSARGFSHSRIWSVATCYAYHFLNEIVENDAYEGVNVDPIADLWIFDPLGMLLFSSDRVGRFFGETLHMRDWSTPPAFDPFTGTLENNADQYMVKWTLPRSERWSLFYHFGLNGLLGLSLGRPDGPSWSVGAGMMSRQQKVVRDNGQGRILTVDLIWNAGVFYDRNGSLMASLLFSGSRAYKAKLNLFPGVVRFNGVSPWLFCGLGQENEVIAGGGVRIFPLGLSVRSTGYKD